MELIGKSASNNTHKIGLLPSASKYVPITFLEQCLQIINNNARLNGLKGIKKEIYIITVQTSIKFLNFLKE